MINVQEFLNFSESLDLESTKSGFEPKENNNDFIDLKDSNSDELLRTISVILAVEQQWNKANPNSEWCCLSDMIESTLTPKQQKKLLDQIHATGFSRLKEAFWMLNKACETMLCEPEDLFGIFKRRSFNHRDPLNDKDRICFIGRYINLTLMQFKLIRKRDKLPLFLSLQSSKSEAISTILPVLKTIATILEGKVGGGNTNR